MQVVLAALREAALAGLPGGAKGLPYKEVHWYPCQGVTRWLALAAGPASTWPSAALLPTAPLPNAGLSSPPQSRPPPPMCTWL
jgi:hypothetical protein